MLKSINIDWSLVSKEGTTNIELRNLLSKIFNINDVNIVSDDELIISDNICNIVNYQSSHEPGSHWYAVILQNNTLHVYDSLGAPPDDVIIDLARRRNLKIITTDEQNQSYDSSLCGLWAVWAILLFKNGMNPLDIYKVVEGKSLQQREHVLILDLLSCLKTT